MRSLLVLLTLSTMACATSKTYTLATLPQEQLHFSYGGGFTGEYQHYMLLPNGQLFYKREVINALPFREVAPLDAKDAQEFFSTYEKQGFAELSYDDPGNMSYTILQVVGTDTTRMVWGGDNERPTEAVRSYWRRVMQAFDGKASGARL